MKTKLLKKMRRRYSWRWVSLSDVEDCGYFIVSDHKKKSVETVVNKPLVPYLISRVLCKPLYSRLLRLNQYHRELRRIGLLILLCAN